MGACSTLLELEQKDDLLSLQQVNKHHFHHFRHLALQADSPQVLIGAPPDSSVSPVLGFDLDLRRVAFSKVGTYIQRRQAKAQFFVPSFSCVMLAFSKVSLVVTLILFCILFYKLFSEGGGHHTS